MAEKQDMTENRAILLGVVIVIIGILSLTAICWYGSHQSRVAKIDNFQKTIGDLSDEQKCIHICGFEFRGYFESYKFCMEKCDRISEREMEVCRND